MTTYLKGNSFHILDNLDEDVMSNYEDEKDVENDEIGLGLGCDVEVVTSTKTIYNYISRLIDGSVYFGAYPVQEMVHDLVTQKFDVLVNLVEDTDILYKYTTPKEMTEITFPIKDGNIPNDTFAYCKLIFRICSDIEAGKKVYIHCRAGHSRSSMVCISVLCVLYDYDLKSAVYKVMEAHKKRLTINPRWKTIKSTINYHQHLFLMKIHKNIYLNNAGFYKWIFSEEDVENTVGFTIKELNKYFLDKFSNNNFVKNKLQYTFLRKFIFPDTNIYYKYGSVLNQVRKKIIELHTDE